MDIRNNKVGTCATLHQETTPLMLIAGTETLIVWTEPNGTDMALSFQEPEGCAAIWFVLQTPTSNIIRRASNWLTCIFFP